MKGNVLRAAFAGALAALSAYFHLLLFPLLVLLGVVVLDYATGMAKAAMKRELNSRDGKNGILKKLGYGVIVAVAMVVDYLIRSALAQVGIHIELEFAVALLVTVWLIVNELISILENLCEMGVPVPAWLSRLIARLKVHVDETGGDGKEG